MTRQAILLPDSELPYQAVIALANFLAAVEGATVIQLKKSHEIHTQKIAGGRGEPQYYDKRTPVWRWVSEWSEKPHNG